MERCVEAYGGQFDPHQCRTSTWPAPEYRGAEEKQPSSSVPKKSSSRRNAWGNMSYADLITKAILDSTEKRLTLAQIYEWMVRNISYFKDKGDNNSSAGWKNSIRHNLSLHNRFMRVQNEGTGKSSWWMINPDAKPGKSPRRRATVASNKPERKRGRLKKKTPAELQRRNSAVPTPSPSSSTSENADSPIHPGYQTCSNYRAITSATSQFSPIVDQSGPPFTIYRPNQDLVCSLPEPIKPFFTECAPADVGGQAAYSHMEPYGHYPTPPRGSPHYAYDSSVPYIQPCYSLYSDSHQQYCAAASQNASLSTSYHATFSTTHGTSLSATAGQVMSHLTSLFSPTDADLNGVAVQGGLECDVDQVLTHELSFGDVLDFAGDASISVPPLPCQHPCVH